MPWYNDLRPSDDTGKETHALLFPDMSADEKKRTISSLLALRAAIHNEIAPKLSDENLVFATWNLKEFGHLKDRLPESYFYIAEIINAFDIVAIQEVKTSLVDLGIIMRLLGSNWAYMIADITEGTDGNSERFAYLYDTRRIQLSGLAGEIVLWDEITQGSAIKQLKRTPFMTGFRAGWKVFAVINLHLQPGDDDDDKAKRKEEVRLLLKAIRHKLDKKRFWTENLLIVGDTNLYKEDADIVQLFSDEGFTEIDDLAGVNTNVSDSQIYDRLFFHETEYFKIADFAGVPTGGVFKMFDHVFQDGDVQQYHQVMLEQKNDPSTLTNDDKFLKYFRNHWRRGQMSDHNPVWMQLRIDSTNDFLNEKLTSLNAQ